MYRNNYQDRTTKTESFNLYDHSGTRKHRVATLANGEFLPVNRLPNAPLSCHNSYRILLPRTHPTYRIQLPYLHTFLLPSSGLNYHTLATVPLHWRVTAVRPIHRSPSADLCRWRTRSRDAASADAPTDATNPSANTVINQYNNRSLSTISAYSVFNVIASM